MAKSRELGAFDVKEGIGNSSYQPNSIYQPHQHQILSPDVFVTSDDDSSFAFVLEDVLKPTRTKDSQWERPHAELSRVDRRQTPIPLLTHPRTGSINIPKLPPTRHDTELSFDLPSSPEAFNINSVSQVKQKKFHLNTNLIDLGSSINSPFNHSSLEENSLPQANHENVSERSRLETFTATNSDSLAHDFSQLASDLQEVAMEVGSLELGSLVEVTLNGRQYFGVVRWSGRLKDSGKSQILVGVELEHEVDEGTDGSYLGHQYFRCPCFRGVFVPLKHCKIDSRFNGTSAVCDVTMKPPLSSPSADSDHGGPDCPSVSGELAPVGQFGDWSKLTGKFKGIQGHHNSCYLDATLFSMFAFTSIFDGLLFRPPTPEDIPHYQEVQRILREEVVNPLRQRYYVRSDKVMKLRRLLQKLSSTITGLTNEEKDPEEFLHCLLAQTLRAEPFLKLSSGQEAYHHQLFVEKDEKLLMPSVQQLFEQSFLSSGIKLKEVPPTLIIQMPRFGKSYKMYPYVLPSSLLDITDVLENSPRQCIVCGHLAEMECQECLGQCGNGLESISFCASCLLKVHKHKKRTNHKAQPLKVPGDFAALQEHCVIPRIYMELFSVVCIATSHYVAFVKCGPGPDAPWCFFDSMADRKGELNGFNIPEVVACPDLPRWLNEDWDKQLLCNPSDLAAVSSFANVQASGLPDHVRRLFSDAYMCLYQSPDLMLYR